MNYDMPVYRPPSEASSLILQVTLGCSHNGCTFCGMYKGKQFHIKSWQEIKTEIETCGRQPYGINRVFLADGDALAVDTGTLLKTLNLLYKTFPNLERVGIYAGPKDIHAKSKDELVELGKAGLKIFYLGIESGSDKILKAVNKGVNSEQMIKAGKKIMDSGLQLSATIILGLGGKELWQEHARETAAVVSAVNPTYLGALTLMVVPDTPLYKKVQRGDFEVPNSSEILKEIKLLLANVNLSNCTFRSNHASNYLPLRGILNQDRDKLVKLIENALEQPDKVPLRPEYFRGL
ncbi:MAG: B12-binding domain-containing radical SAM protein [Firmicutes bacterium]|nr:B12-binding domain-containing radical SAM protein [Bacillota bacterium]